MYHVFSQADMCRFAEPILAIDWYDEYEKHIFIRRPAQIANSHIKQWRWIV